jgi:hypothetical protein
MPVKGADDMIMNAAMKMHDMPGTLPITMAPPPPGRQMDE